MGIIKNSGAPFFRSGSTSGKLASFINNLVVIFKDRLKQGKVGTSTNIGWVSDE